MNAHEAGFLNFIEEPQRRRVRTLLELGEKKRAVLLDMLHHRIRLDPRYSETLPGAEQFVGPLMRRLTGLGAPETCYVIGAGELDGREVSLENALTELVVFGDGAFLSCIPGCLGYYQFEAPNGGRLCRK